MNNNKVSEAVDIMIKTDRLHKQLIDSSFANIGLHRTEHRVLMHIAKSGVIDSQKALADHIGITPAAMTGVLKRLEKNGYIVRKHGSDSRYNEIEITEKGNSIVKNTMETFDRVDKSLFYDFTEEELQGYISFLNKIKNNIMANLCGKDDDSE